MGCGRPSKTVIAELVDRVQDHQRYGIPGDWGERVFRGWLSCRLLHGHFQLDCYAVVQGETFDVLLMDTRRMIPVIYIETKNPLYPLTSRHERETEERCREYMLRTIEHAYLTNGHEWKLYDVLASSGSVNVEHRLTLNLEEDSNEDFERLLNPMRTVR